MLIELEIREETFLFKLEEKKVLKNLFLVSKSAWWKEWKRNIDIKKKKLIIVNNLI